MKHTIVLILSILSIHSSILSQETLSIEEMRLKGGDRIESIPIINDKTNELTLFIIDRKALYFNRYDESFKLIEQQKFDRPKTSAKRIIKAVNQDQSYIFLLTNDKHSKFELLKFDAAQKKINLITSPIFPSEQDYLKTFTYKNQICVLTIQRKTSKLNIYKIGVNGAIDILDYDFEGVEFLDKFDRPITFYRAMLKDIGNFVRKSFELETIEPDVPNSLEIASKAKKLYIKENKAVISIDNNNKHTQLLTLDLGKVDYKIVKIKKPELLYVDNQDNLIKSNSFLAKNRLYQIVGKKGQMRLFVTDIHSKELVKQLALQKEDSITFKNSPIIQEGGYYSNYREMEKTQKFLRKISSGDIAVAVQQLGDTTKVTLGGVKEINTGGYGMPMMGFGAVGGAMTGLANAFMTPTFYAYSSYTTTKSTRIHCLFNEQLDHLSGEVSKNAFDKIKEFSKELLNEKAETIFKYNGYYVYGYYESLHKRYYLRKFMD